MFYASSKDRCLRALVASGADVAEAEEAVAEAFARAWASWPTVSRHPSPVAWVVRTARNHHVSWWRRTRREVALDEGAGALLVGAALSGSSGSPDGSSGSGERDDLLRAVRVLPLRQREVVALRVFLDLDTAQTAQVLGIAPGTVTAHLHRAMTALRVHITMGGAPTNVGHAVRTAEQKERAR